MSSPFLEQFINELKTEHNIKPQTVTDSEEEKKE
jgi:hypothetical protein